jgi:hypothetical protein
MVLRLTLKSFSVLVLSTVNLSRPSLVFTPYVEQNDYRNVKLGISISPPDVQLELGIFHHSGQLVCYSVFLHCDKIPRKIYLKE